MTIQEYKDKVAKANSYDNFEKMRVSLGSCRAYSKLDWRVIDQFAEEEYKKLLWNCHAESLALMIERRYNPENEDCKEVLRDIIKEFIDNYIG